MKDKRYYKRFERECVIKFAANGTLYRGTTRDLSLSGLFIRTEHTFELSTMLTLVIHLTNGKTSQLKGKVMRTTEDGMGVQLTEKDSAYLLYYSDCLLNSGSGSREGKS